MTHFADRLIEAIEKKGSCVVVGLDPRVDLLPESIQKKYQAKYSDPLRGVSEAFFEFNQRIIDAVCDYVPAVKPQVAFYESYGFWGFKVFQETALYAKQRGLLVIGDVKRGDIGFTSEAYSWGYLGEAPIWDGERMKSIDLDSITINPYLGSDGVLPFIEDARRFEKGVFILLKTSNRSSRDLQDLQSGGRKVFEIMADHIRKWGEGTEGERGYRSVGAVVGATYPEEAKILRKLLPNVFFLVPGYGAQGAKAEDILPSFNADRYGAIVNSSRGISFAYTLSPYREEFSPEQFEEAARKATQDMIEEINNVLGTRIS